MNCKAGDLAIVIVGKYSGKLVSVLYRAPAHKFLLPDGVLNVGEPDGKSWVVEVLGSPVWTPMNHGSPRFARYGSASDNVLRPLPGASREKETRKFEFNLA
jgi:hypothetical protein